MTTDPNNGHYAQVDQIEVYHPPITPHLPSRPYQITTQGVAGQTAALLELGMESLEVQGLLSELQGFAASTANETLTRVTEQLAKLQRRRFEGLVHAIMVERSIAGQISKNRVLLLIQQAQAKRYTTSG